MSKTLADIERRFEELVEQCNATAKSVPYTSGTYAQNPYIDLNQKNRSPNALELIRENLCTAYACADLNAQLVASTPLRLYVRRTARRQKSYLMERGATRPVSRKGLRWLQYGPDTAKMVTTSIELEEVTDHPLLDLLAQPTVDGQNGVGVSQYTLFEIVQAYQEVVGRCYLWKEPGRYGLPKSLWILAPQLTQEMPSLSGKAVVERYYFTSAFGKQEYDPDEIIPLRMPDLYTAGYLGGMSPLRACIEKVKLVRQVDANTLAVLQNEGRPSAVFTPKGGTEGDGIGREEVARMAAAYQAGYARAGRGGIYFSEFPGQLTPLQWSPTEILDIGMYKITKEDIANAFAVPTSILDRKDSNLASAETGDYAHARYAGIPRLRRNEAALNHFLVPAYDKAERWSERQLFFAYDKPLGLENMAAEFERTRSSANLGMVSPNELRDICDMPPFEGGDAHYINSSMTPIDGRGMPMMQYRGATGVGPQPHSDTPPGKARLLALNRHADEG